MAASVSVIIPFRNQSAYLPDVLASIEAQTMRVGEVILVNDDSTEPNIRRTLRTIVAPHANVKIFHQKRSKGVGASRNFGAEKAKGKFILFLDADDRLDPTFVEKTVLKLKKNPLLSFVYTHTRCFGKSEQIMKAPEYNLYDLLRECKIPSCALIRRKDFEAVGGFDPQIKAFESPSWDLWIKMGRKHFYGGLFPEPLFHYRVAENKRALLREKHVSEAKKLLRQRHRSLFYFWNRWHLRCQWGGQPQPGASTMDALKRPEWVQRLAARGLTDPHAWRKHTGRCLVLLIPTSWRKIFNKLWGGKLFSEQHAMADYFPKAKEDDLGETAWEQDGAPELPRKSILFFLPEHEDPDTHKFVLTLLRHLAPEFRFLCMSTSGDYPKYLQDYAERAEVYHLPHLWETEEERKAFLIEKIETHRVEQVFLLENFLGFHMIPELRKRFPEMGLSTILHGWNRQEDFSRLAALYVPFLEYVICTSASMKKHFGTLIDVEHHPKIVELPHVPDSFHLEQEEQNYKPLPVLRKSDPDQKNIVFTGHFEHKAHAPFFLDIARFALQHLELEDYRFYLFGEGQHSRKLRRQAQEINESLGREMVFVQPQPSHMTRVWQGGDLCVHLSYRKGGSLALLEAIFGGVRVCAWEDKLFSELLPQNHFYPVPKKSKYPLEAFMQRIFAATSEPLSESVKQSMKSWVREEFRLSYCLEQYRQIFYRRDPEAFTDQQPLELIFMSKNHTV